MNLGTAIDQLTDHVGVVRELIYKDDKTELGNALSLSKAAAAGEFEIVIFGDMNDFKSLNDSFGHDAGDAAITQIGERIFDLFVDDDEIHAKAYRKSGDEFVLLIQQGALGAFEALVPQFAAVGFRYKDQELHAKMSFGVAIADEETDFEELVMRAETACRSAKSLGDGVCVRWDEAIQRNSPVNKRKTCRSCRTVNSCSIPSEAAAGDLKLCAFCGESFV